MAGSASELERLFITLLADDSRLEAAYDKAIARAKVVAGELERSFAAGGARGFDRAAAALGDDARDGTAALAPLAKALEAVTTATAALRQSVESSATSNERAVGLFSDLRDAATQQATALQASAGEFRAFTTTAGEVARSLAQVGASSESAAAGVSRQKPALDAVQVALAAVKNETASLRNAVEAGLTPTDQAIIRFRELQASALGQAKAFEVTSKEYRGFTQAAAQASRSIATLEGRATKLGFSANAAVGISAALRQNIGLLGPAGTSAARGLDLLGSAFGGFKATAPGVAGSLDGILKGFTRLGNFLPLLAGLAAGAAIGGLVRLGNVAAEVADKVDKGSQAAGLSAEAYQELRFAFDQNGVSAEKFDKSMQTLTRRIGEAATGNTSFAQSFRNLGVSIRDAQGQVRGTEEVFTDAVAAISRLPSAAEQAAAASSLFGDRIGAQLLPALKNGVSGIDSLRQAARAAGLVISGDAVLSLVQYKDTMAALKQQIEVARTEITAGFIPVLTNVLIPLLQNVVVPWFQRAAEKVLEFSRTFLDQGAAGAAFRADIAANIVAIQTIADALIGLGRISVGLVQVLTAPFAALGRVIGTLSISFDDFLEVYRKALRGDFSGFLKSPAEILFPGNSIQEAVDASIRQAQAGLNNLVDGGQQFFSAFDFEGNSARINEWLDGLASDVRAGASKFGEAGEEAGSSYADGIEKGVGKIEIPPPPLGSIAGLRAEAAAARKEFELAVTNEARAGALAREAIANAEIARITAIFSAADPLKDARLWTSRLAFELELGLKSAAEVFDIINPRLEELRVEASSALSEFGFNSAEFQEAYGKLGLLEQLLARIGAVRLTITPKVEVADAKAIAIPDVSVQVRGTLADLEQELSRARDRLRNAATAAGRDAAQAVIDDLEAQIAEIKRQYEAIDITFKPKVEVAPATQVPLPDISVSVASSLADLNRRLDEARARFNAAGTAAGRDAAAAVVEALRAEINEIERQYKAIDVRITPTVTITAPSAEQLIRDDLSRRLDVAAAAAEAFGTTAELASARTGLLQGAIQSLLLLDPTNDVQDLVDLWAQYAQEAADADAATRRQTQALSGLDSALASLQSLAGEAPTQFEAIAAAIREAADAGVIAEERLGELLARVAQVEDAVALSAAMQDLEEAYGELARLSGVVPDEFALLAESFTGAAAAGAITTEELERLLEVLRELKAEADFELRLDGITTGLQIGQQIVDGIDQALSGIKLGDLPGAIQGFTGLAAAIGTLIGGPAVGALIGAAGGLLGSLAKLFQGAARPQLPDENRVRAAGAAAPRGAPSLELNFTFNQSLALASLTDPASRSALQQSAADAFAQFERALTANVIPRLERLEGRVVS